MAIAKRKKQRKVDVEFFDIADIEPLTDNQSKAFSSNKNLILCGSAGCGKSFLASYFGLMNISRRRQKNITIIRSAVPSRDMGFLPGNESEKSRIYEEPYIDIFSELLGRGDAYSILKSKNFLHFMTTSYLRGITLRNSYIIIDECQNASFSELNTIMTRVGKNCKIVFCGDFKQSDLKDNGMKKFLSILEKLKDEFDLIEFGTDDIVRSGLVKKYLIACEESI